MRMLLSRWLVEAFLRDEQLATLASSSPGGRDLCAKASGELNRSGGRYALVTMCIACRQGIAKVFERLDRFLAWFF